MNREAGNGPVRIGSTLKLDEGLYSLLFISTMHSNYIYYYLNIHNKKEGQAAVKIIAN